VALQLTRRGALALLLVAAPATAERRAAYGGRAVGTLPGRPASLDPALARTAAEVAVAGLVFDALYRLDDRGDPVPHLALGAPQLSADARQARIELRTGIGFHDGRPLGPADVVASLDRARRLAPGLAPIAGVHADGGAIVLDLGRVTPELTTLLAAPAASITPGGAAPGERPVGSGPFVVAAVDERARELRLVAHGAHLAGRPHLDALVLRWYEAADLEPRAYEAGAIDLSGRGAVAFAGHVPKHPTEVATSPATILSYVGFGRARPLLADRDVRRALSRAIGRDGLARLGRGEAIAPTTLPIPVALGGRVDASPADAAGGRAALALARTRLGALAGVRLEVLVDRSRPDDRELGEKIVAALFRLGLDGALVELGPGEHARRIASGTCDLYVGQLALPTNDPGAAWAAAFAAGADGWAAGALARAPLDPAAASAAFTERLPIVPLLHRAARVHHRADLRGVELDLLGRVELADAFRVPARPR
jgi:peptide/nickel transport system substrate-binding protein